MMIKAYNDIIKHIERTQKRDKISHNLARAMEAAHLDEIIPCPDHSCDFDVYARTYEKVDSELMFGEPE